MLETDFSQQHLMAVPDWTIWIACALLTAGMGLLCLRCTGRAVFHLTSAFSANNLVELPAPLNSDTKAGEHGE